MPFTCSICGEESTRICTRCTKDACDNHLCEKCLRCSDCCECAVKLSEPARVSVHSAVADPVEAVIPGPEPTMPEPEPSPAPEDPAPIAP
jgi:transcription elongation factor Elf1